MKNVHDVNTNDTKGRLNPVQFRQRHKSENAKSHLIPFTIDPPPRPRHFIPPGEGLTWFRIVMDSCGFCECNNKSDRPDLAAFTDDHRPDPHHEPRRRGRQDRLILFFCRGFILESLLPGSRLVFSFTIRRGIKNRI